MDPVICARRSSRCIEGECDGRVGSRENWIQDSRRFLKREFEEGEKESVKVAELRKLEQGDKTMEEFIQEFKRAARESRYEGRPLVEEFKRGINGVI